MEEDTKKVVYRASGLGTCTRALVAARQGYEAAEPDSQADTYMGEGVLHEDHVLKRMERDGEWEIRGRAQEEIELEVKDTVTKDYKVVIRGHIDEIARNTENGFDHLVEVKTMSESRFRQWQKNGFRDFPGYALQFSTYMIELDMPGVFVVKNRNTGEVVWTVYEEPPVSKIELATLVSTVELLATQGELPPCDDKESWYCKFSYLHESRLNPKEVPEGEFPVTQEFIQLVEAYHYWRQSEDQARWKRDELRGKIVELLGSYDKADLPAFTVERKEVINRRLDNKQVKKMLTKQQVLDATIESPVEHLLVDPKRK